MIAWLLLGALALSQEPCDPTFDTPAATTSVAWVSPVRRRARGGKWLWVVRTSELRDWLTREPEAGVGRTLQWLGMRKKATDPRRRYKVTIFEARAVDLCRPVEDAEGEVVGVDACEGGLGRERGTFSGCGYATDLADGSRGPDLYRIRWRDAAVRGFCVLPAARFIIEGRR